MKACCDKKISQQKPSLTIALLGNPNCGKTTLFNALTGSCQCVGNWPGVTVERKSGYFTQAGKTVEVVDLPGTYSLLVEAAESSAVDERIAVETILRKEADVIVNVVDASNLERHLYLTAQLLEMGAPLILALNMMDVAAQKNIQIDAEKLSRELGCPVLTLTANNGGGVKALKQAVISPVSTCQKKLPHHPAVLQAIQELAAHIESEQAEWLALRLLEEDAYAERLLNTERVREQQLRIEQQASEEADILLADARYCFIQQVLQTCLTRTAVAASTLTTRIDNVVLNRVLGIPIFLAMMYLLFVFTINIGGFFQDFFDVGSQTVFVDGFAYVLNQMHAPEWLTALLANGIGKGINTTLTFIPVIGALFLFLSLLEDSGYMARAAFVIDRFMRMLGLPGKAFVPMIVGFGCNVPAVMAARTLENKRDRILTIMMTPFMSCGARLAIFAVFTTAFFPHGGQNIVFALYLIGIFMAIFTGYLLRTTVLKGDPSPLIMELPQYHLPRLRTLLLHAGQRLKGFVYRAGSLIIPICMLIGSLNALHVSDNQTLLSTLGQWVTPILAPMGIQPDNWPATVGLVTGVLAKEVVIGTLNTLYSQANQLAQVPMSVINHDVYGLMYQRFDGQIGAFSYLLFVLLYFPCVSTMAVMMRELHRGWSIFSAVWMTGVAYGTAVTFYQAATFMRHPLSSSLWVSSIAIVFIVTIAVARWYANGERDVQPIPAGESV
jgi:ferrous iron transport protein B